MIGVVKLQKGYSVDSTRIFVNEKNKKGKRDFFQDFLKYVDRNSKTKGTNDDVIIYFHDLKYDYTTLLPYMYQQGAPCEKDGQIYSANVMFGKRKFVFMDSSKMFDVPLCEFNKTFELNKKYDKKESIAHEYYKLDNIDNQCTDIKEYEKYLNDVDTFRKNLKNNQIDFEVTKKTFNAVEYYKYYLRNDIMVLSKGIEKFSKIIDEITENKIDMFNYLTISSLSNDMMGMLGSFDGLYGVKGNLRDYITKAITGGRVQANKQYVKKVIKKKIADYDGVSQYPAAIDRACNEIGLPKGQAKRINKYTKEELDKFTYYIVDVEITKINKKQQLPMVSYKNEEGILQYTNFINNKLCATIDSVTLQDWVEFQDIEYNIIDGVYWNEGGNIKMGEVINKLFIDRLVQKSKGNEAMQQVLKLMMNSSYGKTITKKTLTVKRIIPKKDHDSYIYNNFNVIKEIDELPNKQKIIKMEDIDDSYNLAHVGVLILSYSKRLMNEVFNVANNNDYPIYYTDTDSMHCNYDDVVKIETKFREIYDRELTGNQLGQFHVDFKMDGVGKGEEIYATKSLFLGNKCYIDKLESKDKNGNTINGIHFRMKGMTETGIRAKSNKTFGGDIFKLYEHLIDGELEMALNPAGYKPMFEYNKNKIYTRESDTYTRLINFNK